MVNFIISLKRGFVVVGFLTPLDTVIPNIAPQGTIEPVFSRLAYLGKRKKKNSAKMLPDLSVTTEKVRLRRTWLIIETLRP